MPANSEMTIKVNTVDKKRIPELNINSNDIVSLSYGSRYVGETIRTDGTYLAFSIL